jgi:hypothetical protein
MQSVVIRATSLRPHSVVIRATGERVPRGHWVVRVGGAVYVFSPADMRRLYSRVPQ